MYCTICQRNVDHVAASCPRRDRGINMQSPRLVDRAIAVAFAVAITVAIRFDWVRNLVT